MSSNESYFNVQAFLIGDNLIQISIIACEIVILNSKMALLILT